MRSSHVGPIETASPPSDRDSAPGLPAVATGEAIWPTFRDGYEVDRIIEAALLSNRERRWVNID